MTDRHTAAEQCTVAILILLLFLCPLIVGFPLGSHLLLRLTHLPTYPWLPILSCNSVRSSTVTALGTRSASSHRCVALQRRH